jgi:hypothetical protein
VREGGDLVLHLDVHRKDHAISDILEITSASSWLGPSGEI